MTPGNRKSLPSKIAFASLVATATSCWAPSVSALEFNGSVYGGVGAGSSEIEPRVNSSGYSVTETVDSGYQIFLGSDISRRLSVEAYYADMGDAALVNDTTGATGAINYTTAGASGLLYLIGAGGADAIESRRGFNIYARLGFGTLKNKGAGIPFSRVNDWHWSSGLGAEYGLKNGFGLRAEFHNFDSDARMVSLNVIKRFDVGGKTSMPVFESSSVEPDTMAKTDEAKDTTKTPLVVDKPASKDSDGDGVPDADDLCDATAEGVSVDVSGCAFTGVLKGVNFASDSATLTPEASKALDKVIAELKKNSEVKISVHAHTDNRGSAVSNMALSRKRAETVVRYLVETGGIALSRVTATGYGESRPRQTNATAAGREANRRVEIKSVK